MLSPSCLFLLLFCADFVYPPHRVGRERPHARASFPPSHPGAGLPERKTGAVGRLRIECFNSLSPGKKRTFLEAYASSGSMREAARIAQVERTNHYYWMETDPAYAAAYPTAKAMAADVLEEEATRRALGWDETRIAEDGTPYSIHKYSDTLLIFRLKALKPDEYRDNAHVSVESTSTLTITIEDRTRQANARLERLRREHQHAIPDALG